MYTIWIYQVTEIMLRCTWMYAGKQYVQQADRTSGVMSDGGVITSQANLPKRDAFAIYFNAINDLYYRHRREQISKFNDFRSGVSSPMNTWIHSILTITSSGELTFWSKYLSGGGWAVGLWRKSIHQWRSLLGSELYMTRNNRQTWYCKSPPQWQVLGQSD